MNDKKTKENQEDRKVKEDQKDRPRPTGTYPEPGTVFPDQEWG